jgi:hypothetical protein
MALQTLEVDAAEARARVRELEAVSLQQSSMLQTRAQSECRLEETIRQLQQVRAACILALVAIRLVTVAFRACPTARRARLPPTELQLNPLQICCWRRIIERSWRPW